MNKKRGKKKFKAKIDRKYLYIALASIILSLSLFFLNFTTTPDNPPHKTASKSTKIDKNNSLPKSDDMIKKMRDILSKSRKELKKKVEKNSTNIAKNDKNLPFLEYEHYYKNSEVMDYEASQKQEKKDEINKDKNISNEPKSVARPKKSEKVKKIVKGKKPKLVIIMDDMAFNWQFKKLKGVPFKVTPSLFPPTKRHPNTQKYAKELHFYMIHLPLEAISKHFRNESDVLKTSFAQDKINKQIKKLRRLFPKCKYINNHTGSKFTSDYNAMIRLYNALWDYGFSFVDSRTSRYSKVKKVSKLFNRNYIKRDVFLDNKIEVYSIKKQIKKAVKIAKKRGYAIAICHPHEKTFIALRESKSLLKDIDVVYLNELFN